MAESEDNSASPDSTTRERLGFVPGEDVLLQHNDGKYYLGTIVEVWKKDDIFYVKYIFYKNLVKTIFTVQTKYKLSFKRLEIILMYEKYIDIKIL